MREFLLSLPFTTNPLILAACSLMMLGMGIFVFLKNPRLRLHQLFFVMSLTLFGWFGGNSLSVLSRDNLDAAFLWFRLGYSWVPFMACVYYHVGLLVLNERPRRLLKFLYCFAILELFYIWCPAMKQNAYIVPNGGLAWPLWSWTSYYSLVAMAKYFFVSVFIGTRLYRASKKETQAFRKLQLRNFAIFFFIVSGGIIEWLVAFDVPIFLAWIVIPPLFAFFAYSVVKYRFLEIDTVIHKTLLWVISIFFIIVPISLLGLIIFKRVGTSLPLWADVLIFAIFLFLFVAYYNKLRPRVDKFFRRKKYDYLEILGAISQQISGILDVEDLSRKTLVGIKETVYPKTIYLFLRDEERKRYYLKSEFVDTEYRSFTRDSASLFVPENSPTVKFLKETGHPVERHILKYDPLYDAIKEDAEDLFQYTETLLLFGLIMEEELVGMLLVGKKESFQDYTRQDINALQNLSLNIAGSFYTSLHHHDILEGHRLLQEVALARHIQENLLPREAPRIPGISLYGLYVPSKEIGGDYYDFIMREGSDNRVYITIGDVSGKGMDAGLVVSSIKSSLVYLTRLKDSPREILNTLNNDLYTSLSQQKFISLLLLEYLSSEGKIIYSSAGHERILIYRNNKKEVEVFKSGGVILGMLDNIGRFLEEQTLVLEKADKVLLYTDGATEARNLQEDLYSLPRLVESFKKHGHLTIQEVIKNIYEDIKIFMSGRDQYDDITLVGIEKE